MIRKTSLEAFIDQSKQDIRNTQANTIYMLILERGAMSAGEIAREIGLPPGRVHARLNDLMHSGAVDSVGIAPVGQGGRNVNLWGPVA